MPASETDQSSPAMGTVVASEASRKMKSPVKPQFRVDEEDEYFGLKRSDHAGSSPQRISPVSEEGIFESVNGGAVSDPESWQDESDTDRPSVSFRTPARSSKLAIVENANDDSSSNISPSATTAQNGSTRPRKGRKLRPRLDKTRDSLSMNYVAAKLSSLVGTGDDTTAAVDSEDGGEVSPRKDTTPRRKLKKTRSKSDTGVNPIPPMHQLIRGRMGNRKSRYSSKSVDLRGKNRDVVDDRIGSDHEAAFSDTELANAISNGEERPRRRFYIRSTTTGDILHPHNTQTNQPETPGNRFMRRISAFDHTTAPGAWKDFKKSIRANLGKRKKKQEVPKIDYEKSTELIYELVAGCPAAIILASQFQRDDRNLKRIPVLLEQIKFRLVDVSGSVGEKNRKYRLDLEYGSGPARLTWSIRKEYKDFWLLHSRLRNLTNPFQTKSKLPKFPGRHLRQSSRGRRALHTSPSHPDMENRRVSVIEDNPRSNASESVRDTRAMSLFSLSSRESSPDSRRSFSTFRQDFLSPMYSRRDNAETRQAQIEQRTSANEALLVAMEQYLKYVFQHFRFRPDANKLFQFLELSNMSIRLAPENSYHGKEGYLFIRSSSASQGWRVSHWRPNDLTQMIQRHTPKWFMVRHSYLVCVENCYETNILEVFLVDSGFKVSESRAFGSKDEDEDEHGSTPNVHISFQLENNERKIKLVAGSDKTLTMWMDSMNDMKEKTIWSKRQRFDSFAPVRKNVHAQWFVDGRDYFWAVSGAIDMAKDVIYIHDWWLSPEIYMRRPPEGNQHWRLDRLLKRKADEGVKIFVIVYRNVGNIVPIDSMYTKHSLLDLHPNIYVMRSPNQLIQNTFFWAHHEKLCLIDNTVAFVGGIDLCFGRWDTPDHVLVDDSPAAFYKQNPNPFNETQIWPGKDYSNPRVQDFVALDRPYQDMYDRKKVPRMPWHDVHMMVFGQPARDLTRHFVQRWNYLLRQKRPSRYTPLLLPPPDLTDEQIRQLDLDGTCETQILRSSGNWSLGLKEPEHSVQNAYLKAIEQSEHFVYIENQFFITSTSLENTKVENRIGDALVERIIRAHERGENWRAVIVIPLMPGFESQVDLPDGSSVRVIMQCQFYSISRGPNSIFARLHKAGIYPDDYIQFFSLRKWGKIGPNKKLVTEQLYVHAKTMIIDDRVAIIGSANINERSMRGNRDSEVACIVRDAHQIDSTMGGEPYKVGHFAHTLRMRLMREHLGIDVDQIDIIERQAEMLASKSQDGYHRESIYSDTELGGPLPNGTLNGSARKEEIIKHNDRGVDEQSVSGRGADERGADDHGVDDRGVDDSIRAAAAAAAAATNNVDDEPVNELPPANSETLAMPTEAIEMRGFNHFAGIDNIGMREKKAISMDSRVQNNVKHRLDVEGEGYDGMASMKQTHRKMLETIKEKAHLVVNNTEQAVREILAEEEVTDMETFKRRLYEKTAQTRLAIDEGRDGAPSVHFQSSASTHSQHPGAPSTVSVSANDMNSVEDGDAETDDSGEECDFEGLPTGPAKPLDPYIFADPLVNSFYYDAWLKTAERNTAIFRKVFRCQPDDQVTTWKEYKEYVKYGQRFSEQQDRLGGQWPQDQEQQQVESEKTTRAHAPLGDFSDMPPSSEKIEVPEDTEKREQDEEVIQESKAEAGQSTNTASMNGPVSESAATGHNRESNASGTHGAPSRTHTRRRRNTRSSRRYFSGDIEQILDPAEAEKILQGVRGHLVMFPADWLARELETGNWFYNLDRIPPVEIYD
ncbi:phospholipase D1 [Trichomonascus vanleenenianus]|uniref:phospholipase D n=1 Tax=Trichomonascus vanleenenianus TaxID=2268995 RepID=UPI003ECB703B